MQQVHKRDPYNESAEELNSQYHCLMENLRRARRLDAKQGNQPLVHTESVWTQIVVFVEYNPSWRERWQALNPFPDRPLL